MALLKAWGTRDGGRNAASDERTAARDASGSALLHLDAATGTVRLAHPEAGLEEGGFLKGYALDAGRKVAVARGAQHGWADFGGQVLAWGTPKRVDIADPQERQAIRVSVLLTEGSLSTSGCSERGRHILDPRTGSPCEAWGSVSVVAASGLEADILSTALYVLGPDQGLAWAETNQVAVLFLLNHGPVRMSRAFAALHPSLFSGDTQ
jgi:thiamine biosynthesis lipoprotein